MLGIKLAKLVRGFCHEELSANRKEAPRLLVYLLSAVCFLILAPSPAIAYIGPGAGFAFLGSSLVFVVAIGMALVTLLLLPARLAIQSIRRLFLAQKSKVKRVIIVGLDGMEPKLVDQYVAEGRLPNLAKLAGGKKCTRLGTTIPPLSPVAWSTFQTGVNPGAHNIFDFLTRDKRTCLPELASTATERGKVVITRRSQPFWKILGKYGVRSNILRVPISYPPEPFQGNILSAMCTPDLRGTQGTFSLFTTDSSRLSKATGGEVQPFTKTSSDTFEFKLIGPPNPNSGNNEPLSVRGTVTLKTADQEAELSLCDKKLRLKVDQLSDWIEVEFGFSRWRSISGLVRVCLRQLEPHMTLYVSPVNVHPEHPALPIAKPLIFASWLAKKIGLYGTLGLMEDTWGRNEQAIDDKIFLEHAYRTHAERERMFFEALDKTRSGVCACVFDATDRVQHMFWRYLDPQHPAPKENGNFERVIPELYAKMDEFVGRVQEKLGKDDALIILSDHGFASFRRGINLNRWLLERGLLAVKSEGVTGADYLQDVDWSKTKAYAVGLSGIYLNLKGRERYGIVAEEEADAILTQIQQGLESLQDEPPVCCQASENPSVIRHVYRSRDIYRGLYVEDAPDLIVGYAPGYRVSWDSVTGSIEPTVFSDNTKAWSGDHQVDHREIPGVLFSNLPIQTDTPHIIDLAPSVLSLFGVPAPRYMEGKPLF